MKKIIVIGALNLDICGRSTTKFMPGDSTIGEVSHSIGGVGYNIARNLSKLGMSVSFMSAMGEDDYAQMAREDAASNNIDISHTLVAKGFNTSTYLFITDENGDMVAAINDMKCIGELKADYIYENRDFINSHDAILVDANLREETLHAIGNIAKVPIFADAVSAHKADRLLPIIEKISILKPNEREIEALTEIEIKDEEAAEKATGVLCESGVGVILMTWGKLGVYLRTREKGELYEAPKARVKNTSGAGDTFLAAAIWGHLNGYKPQEYIRAALLAAKFTLESELTFSPKLNERVLREEIEKWQ